MSLINNFIDFFSKDTKVNITDKDTYNDIILPSIISGNNWDGNALAISGVYTAIKTLSETISKLPISVYKNGSKGKTKLYNHYLYDIIHYNPNNYLTSQSFFQTLELHRNHKGNSFALINRNKNTGRVNNLEIISPSKIVNYDIINGELYYKYQNNNNETITIHSNDILHFKQMSNNGIWGLNPIEALRLNLSTTAKGLKTIDSFYENNANTSKAIKSTVSGANQKAMLEAINNFRNEYSGAVNAGKILPLPPNTELQDVTMNFVDAAFISTIKFNADQIAAIYGVPSYLLGNFESSKFNNVEQLNLNFKINTISAILRMYRQELEFKLLTKDERKSGISIEFNANAMVETDYRTRTDGYKTLQGVGAITPNDIAKLEGYPTFKNGDKHYIFNQMTAIEDMNNNNKDE